MCKISHNRIEVRAMIDTRAIMNLMEASLVPHLSLQVTKANIVVSFTSYYRLISNRTTVANLSKGTWVREARFMVMVMSRFDVILIMELLYNAEVHVLLHLSFIWIGGIMEPCTVECKY